MIQADILEDFLVKDPKGYYCRYGDFYVDPLYPVDTAVVSHAHGDHATPGHKRTIATEATLQFMSHRFNRRLTGNLEKKEYRQEFTLGEVRIMFLSAGHMLGSAQILMVYRGVSYLYTGDYKLTVDLSCPPVDFEKADVLITETTFADPGVQHPDPDLEIQKLKNRPVKIMLGCYALGKAQSLTALINKHCPEIEVCIHRNMAAFHRVYNELGPVKLKYTLYNRRDFKQADRDKIYMVPPITFNNYYRATGVLRAFASGWDRLHHQNDISLYISDHVDWGQIIDYINRVQPREVWTVHGEGEKLAEYFKNTLKVRKLFSENTKSQV